jgi:Uma2 family endonuclease
MAIRANVRFTSDDIWDRPDDGNRYEVIDGALYVTPAPGWAHQHASSVLHGYVWQYVHRRQLGYVVSGPIGVVLDDETAIQPDLVYVSNDRAGIIVERGIEGAPDLVVEILSPRTRSIDRGLKMRRYAAAGISHYWIVDPNQRTLTAYQLTESGYVETGTFGPGTTFKPELFSGLGIPVDDLRG